MSMEYIRRYYGVPAKRGGDVWFKGHEAKITGSRGPYLLIRLSDDPKRLLQCHPTWEMEYPLWEPKPKREENAQRQE